MADRAVTVNPGDRLLATFAKGAAGLTQAQVEAIVDAKVAAHAVAMHAPHTHPYAPAEHTHAVAPTPVPTPTEPTPTEPPPTGPEPTLNLDFFGGFPGTTLDPRLVPVYVPGDPGFGLDSDFLGNTSQVTVANGLLTITAERRATPSGRPFASACIGTKGTFAQLYGAFEARIRHPLGQGSFPAFWLLRAGSNQTPPEIDVMEAYPGSGLSPSKGSSGAGVLVQTLHTAASGARYVAVDGGEDMTRDFHVYRIIWRPSLLEFYVDGEMTNRLTTDIPNVPMYPILNLAVGAPGYRADSTTPAVMRMDVDYVRVWA